LQPRNTGVVERVDRPAGETIGNSLPLTGRNQLEQLFHCLLCISAVDQASRSQLPNFSIIGGSVRTLNYQGRTNILFGTFVVVELRPHPGASTICVGVLLIASDSRREIGPGGFVVAQATPADSAVVVRGGVPLVQDNSGREILNRLF